MHEDLIKLADTKASVLERRCASAAWECVIQYRLNMANAITTESRLYWSGRIADMQMDYREHTKKAQTLESEGQ